MKKIVAFNLIGILLWFTEVWFLLDTFGYSMYYSEKTAGNPVHTPANTPWMLVIILMVLGIFALMEIVALTLRAKKSDKFAIAGFSAVLLLNIITFAAVPYQFSFVSKEMFWGRIFGDLIHGAESVNLAVLFKLEGFASALFLALGLLFYILYIRKNKVHSELEEQSEAGGENS